MRVVGSVLGLKEREEGLQESGGKPTTQQALSLMELVKERFQE